MIFLTDKILEDVRICLDKNVSSESLFAEGDEEALLDNSVIRSKILEGIRRVHLTAPYHLLEQGHNLVDDEHPLYWGEEYGSTQNAGWDSLHSGWLLLPDDFMRLVVFEMSDWEKAVYSVIDTLGGKYDKQRSRYRGVRGNPQRPICALGIHPEGRVLEFYSCNSRDAQVSKAVYIPHPKFVDVPQYEESTSLEGVDISKRCYEAVIYTIAGLTLLSIGDIDRSNVLFNTSNSLLSI